MDARLLAPEQGAQHSLTHWLTHPPPHAPPFSPLQPLWQQMHLFFVVGVLTFMVLPATTAAALWLGGLFVYYSATAFGQPEHTGRREWPAFQAWMGAQLERFLPSWLGERAGWGLMP